MRKSYALKKLNAGSSEYGKCEVCQREADIMHHLKKFKNKGEKSFYSGDLFGHRDCLAQQTEGE